MYCYKYNIEKTTTWICPQLQCPMKACLVIIVILGFVKS